MHKKKIELDFDSIGNQKQTIIKEEKKVLSDYFSSRYYLNKFEKKAIDEALVESKKGYTLSHENVVNEAKQKYPNLNFS